MRVKANGLSPKYANEYAAGLDIYNNGDDITIQRVGLV